MVRTTPRRLRALVVAAIGAGVVAISIFAAGTVFAAPGTATVGTDGWARFTVSPDAGAARVWIEIEDPGIDASDVAVRLNGTGQPITSTVLGAIANVPASGSPQQFAVALTTAASPDIAVTVIDGAGTILSSTVYRLALVDYRTLPQGAALTGGFLGLTGLNAELIALLAVTALGATALGYLLWRRGRQRIQA